MKLTISDLKENLLNKVEKVKLMTGISPTSIRKSLPEFRGHINRNYTAFYEFQSLCQEIDVKKALRSITL